MFSQQSQVYYATSLISTVSMEIISCALPPSATKSAIAPSHDSFAVEPHEFLPHESTRNLVPSLKVLT